MEHASQVRNMGSQQMSVSTSSSSQRISEVCTLPQQNVELQETSTHSGKIERCLHQHLQQGDAAKEEAAMRSFIMHRFLPAAKEVAAEHESFRASLTSKNHSEASCPSLPQQSRRTPIAHHIKPRAQQAAKGFTPSSPLHSQHQEDGMPNSMRSCGFFCQGLKAVLFCAHRTVSASGCSTLSKKSRGPPSNHLKASDVGISSIISHLKGPVARKKEAKGGVTKHQSGINVDIPILHPFRSPNSANGQESPRRHAMTYHASFSRRGCPSSDGCTNIGCNPPLSQLGKVNLAGNRFENMKSMQTSHDDHVSARKFVSMALKEQDNETVQEGVAPCNQKRTRDCGSTCVCDHVNNLPPHDLAGENMSRSTLGGLETNGGKSAHAYSFRSTWQDGDDDEDDEPQFFDALSRLNSVKSNDYSFRSAWQGCVAQFFDGVDDEDDEPQFFDALSSLNSVNSNATFCTSDSPRSECEVLGFEGEWVNDEMDFTDASSHFETPLASTSENKSVLSYGSAANEKGMSGKMSSLSQRVGKGLKLETERKQAISPSRHHPCAYEQQHEPQQTELETRRFSRLWHRSLDNKSQKHTPNVSGWPFRMSSYQSNKVGGSPYHSQQERSIEDSVAGGNVPPPPLPPSPTEPWLGKAITKNASKISPLATLQQEEKVASARKTVDSISENPDGERRWEDVVKGSQVHREHLRYSEELEILILTSL